MSRKKVVIVEDNANDILLYERVFKKFLDDKYELQIFENGDRALSFFRDLPKTCLNYIIFLDIKMPKVSGLEVLQYLRSEKEWERMPVIMLTSSDQFKDIGKAYTLGATSYIEKPKDYMQLKTQLPRIISYFDNELYECGRY